MIGLAHVVAVPTQPNRINIAFDFMNPSVFIIVFELSRKP